jgi:DNA modification methylase
MDKITLDTYHIGDSREALPLLQSGLVDTTITSPPYWNLKDYKAKKQVGFGQDYDEYLDDLQAIFTEVYRATKPTGSLWIVADTIKHSGELKLFPFDLAARLKRVGWILHDIVIWHKDKTLPWSHRGKLRNIFEYILFFSKDKRFKYYLSEIRETEGLKEWWVHYPERYSPGGKAPTRTWSIPIPRQGSWGENWVSHFCPLPPKLVRRIVLLTTKKGDVVLDPFAGSGVVLAQARALKRHYVGFDLRRPYRRMFESRVLPSITSLEREIEQSRSSESRSRREFSSLIWKLRKTKYPRELLRIYQKKYGRTGVVGILARSRSTRSLEIDILFATGKIPPAGFQTRMKMLTRRPPLSKYGLRVTLKQHTLKASGGTGALDRHGLRGKLSLYKDGNTRCPSGMVSGAEFMRLIQAGPRKKTKEVPPIASNVNVEIPTVATSRELSTHYEKHSST